MEKVSELWQGKHIRDLLADASIAYIPQSKNGKDFGSKGWGSGKTKLLISKKGKLWCLYILETGKWEQEQWYRAKAWFDALTSAEKEKYKVFATANFEWEKSHPIDNETTEQVRVTITKRKLQTRIVQYKSELLDSMKPDPALLDDKEVNRVFSLFDNNQHKPNDLNIYGDFEFVFLDDRYSCIAGKEGLSFTEAEEVCMQMIAGE